MRLFRSISHSALCAVSFYTEVTTFDHDYTLNTPFDRPVLSAVEGLRVKANRPNATRVSTCLLVVVHGLVAVLLDEFVALGGLEILAHHLADQFVERDPGRPAELGLG